MRRQYLQRLSREELIREAERAGVPRPRVLTQSELIDEILKRTVTSERDKTRARGWLGRARDLLANVVEKGLHLPDAAEAIRSGGREWPTPPAPLSTVTLAEIYAAQGHLDRAVAVLDEVIEREPDNDEARALRERFAAQLVPVSKRPPASEKKEEPPPSAPPEAEAASETPPEGAAPPTEVAQTDEQPRQASEKETASADQEAATEKAPEPSLEPSDTREEKAQEVSPKAAAQALPAEQTESAGAAEKSPEEATSTTEGREDVSLPARYDVDEVVAIATDPSTFYVYWEIRPTTFAHAVASAPGGHLALRITAVTPGWDGPIVETQDLRIDALFGDRFVHHIRPRADVRVSVGWLTPGRFDPIAVGAEVAAPRGFVSAGAPPPSGAPLDLSEGLRGAERRAHFMYSTDAGSMAPHALTNWSPPQGEAGPGIHGDQASLGGGGRAATGWAWSPVGERMLVTYGPTQLGPLGTGAVEASATMGMTRDGSWWVDEQSWVPVEGGGFGGASERRWGGASERRIRWGGASERPWGGASERRSGSLQAAR